MSVHISAMVWDALLPSSAAKLVMLALADFANKEGVQCFPSVRTIAAMCSLSESGTKAQLRALQDMGLITKAANFDTNGRQRSNNFEICLARLAELREGSPAAPSSNPAPPRGHLMAGEGFPPNPPGGHLLTPFIRTEEPPAEPPEKPIIAVGSNASLFDLPIEPPTVPVGSMTRSWNLYTPSLPKITVIVGSRLQHAKTRYADLGGTMADWDAFCQRVEKADKLTGRFKSRKPSQWKADFDWCMNPHNFAKIREGKYDPQPTPTKDANAPRFF